MNKIEALINDRLMPIAIKIQNSQYMSAISDGFSMILPITMLGAIFTLVSSMQFKWYQNF